MKIPDDEPVDPQADRADGASKDDVAGSESIVGGSSARTRTLAVAIVVLLVLEIVVGLMAASLNGRIAQADDARAARDEIAGHDGPSALVLGAPQVVQHLPTDWIEEVLDGDGRWMVRSVGLDGSMAFWQTAFDELFVVTETFPSVLILPFVEDQLEDPVRVDWSAIGNLFTSRETLRRRMAAAPSATQRLELAMSWSSSIVGNRRWMFSALTDPIVPSSTSVARSVRQEADEVTYVFAEALVARALLEGVQVVVVAMPSVSERPLPEELLDELRAAGVAVVDARSTAPDPDTQFTEAGRLSASVTRAVIGQVTRQIDAG